MANVSNTAIAAGALGAVAGLGFGVYAGRAIGQDAKPGESNPWPELLGIFGALGGALLFAGVGQQFAPETTQETSSQTTTTTTSTGG